MSDDYDTWADIAPGDILPPVGTTKTVTKSVAEKRGLSAYDKNPGATPMLIEYDPEIKTIPKNAEFRVVEIRDEEIFVVYRVELVESLPTVTYDQLRTMIATFYDYGQKKTGTYKWADLRDQIRALEKANDDPAEFFAHIIATEPGFADTASAVLKKKIVEPEVLRPEVRGITLNPELTEDGRLMLSPHEVNERMRFDELNPDDQAALSCVAYMLQRSNTPKGLSHTGNLFLQASNHLVVAKYFQAAQRCCASQLIGRIGMPVIKSTL